MLLIALAGFAVGCSSGSGGTAPGTAEPTRPVSASDFAAAPSDEPAPPEQAAPSKPTHTISEATGGVSDVAVVVGGPTTPITSPTASASAPGAKPTDVQIPTRSKTFFVDQMVGQINGRPVYAAAFLEPMDARLRQDASKMSSREWLVSTRKLIQQAVADRLRDDLLLAEFQSALTPEMRMGIMAFAQNVREGIISGNFGSESLANQRLREAEGLSLEDKVKDITERRFIIEQLRKAIGSRVHVSYRDIKLYYDQHQDDFLPAPTAVFRIIQASTREEDKIARIEKALASGEDFAAVAHRESAWKPDDENLHRVVLQNHTLEGAAVFGPPALNEAAAKLTPGASTPRVNVGNTAFWIKLERLDQPPGKTLYEAQLEIERRLLAQREDEERLRYFSSLISRGSFSDIQTMIERLLVFAAKKYLGAQEESAARQLMESAPKNEPLPTPSGDAPDDATPDEAAPSEPRSNDKASPEPAPKSP
ncbi:MAG TPA: peptidyl-prolyl cis-trans isomerase [Phycisphaerales bacterium]|nr:peptidyl-prolyl cis-trans isomerase [Phycisphaerales bacterium]